MRTRYIAAVIASVSMAAGIGCTQVIAESSACRNLPYKDGEVPRAQYVPCVGEIVTALEELDRQTEAALAGDKQARADGQTTLRRVIALMNAAGGRQLLERWNDRTLMDLNVDMHNAVSHYQAFYLVRILDNSNPYAATSREAARAEYVGGHRRLLDASRTYRFLK